MRILIIAVTGLLCLVYGYYEGEQAGYHLGELHCLSELKSLETNLTERCLQRIDVLEKNRKQLDREINQYVSSISVLRHKSDTLQLRIKELQSDRQRPDSTPDKSVTSGEFSSRRAEPLGNLLKEATELIRERDEIAESYNELRKKCRLN